MPNKWTPKEEREYQHIKKGYTASGSSTERAEEIAARTVNRQRREDGETPSRRTQGTGNPHTGLESRSKDELENLARDAKVEGRSSMNKDELVKALRKKRGH